jgi:hypothetical protein
MIYYTRIHFFQSQVHKRRRILSSDVQVQSQVITCQFRGG